MKNGFFLSPDKLNRGYVISALGFLLYLAVSALAGQGTAGVIAIPFALFSAYVFLSVNAARKMDKESAGYNLLWGCAALTLLLGTCAVLSIKLWLGL